MIAAYPIQRAMLGGGSIDAFLIAPPAPVAGMAAWWNSYTGVTKNGSDLVSVVADQSGNARNLIVPIPFAGDRGLWEANQINGKAAIHFRNGPGQFNYLQAAFTLDQPFTVYYLFKTTTHDAGGAIFDGATAICGSFQGGAANSLQILAPTGFANGTDVDGQYEVATLVFNGASSSLQIDNKAVATGAIGANNPGGITINCRFDIGALWSDQYFVEMLVYTGVQSAAEQAQNKAYLAYVGGLTI